MTRTSFHRPSLPSHAVPRRLRSVKDERLFVFLASFLFPDPDSSFFPHLLHYDDILFVGDGLVAWRLG